LPGARDSGLSVTIRISARVIAAFQKTCEQLHFAFDQIDQHSVLAAAPNLVAKGGL
jgi:hypothetical protein